MILGQRFNIEVKPLSEEEIEQMDIECEEEESAILEKAIEEEKGAVRLYEKGLETATKQKIRDVFEQLIADEEYHRDMLTNLYAQLIGKPPDM